VIVRIMPPAEGRFADMEVMRRALLDAPISQVGGGLGIDEVAPKVTRIAVPHFCNVGGLVVRETLIAEDELSVIPPDGSLLLRRIVVETDDGDPRWDAGFPAGELLRYPADSPYARCIASREPVIEAVVTAEQGPRVSRAWRERPVVAELLTGTSVLSLPLVARGVVLGLLVCIRKPGYRCFDSDDVQIGMQFAARAAVLIDNGRRYSRERATALTLQRSLLPTGLSAPSCVEVHHRYLPASKLVEVGGDWYEAIALPGGRAALAVGDVAGHGVQAAVTMGRLRTAIHTLAKLELPPGEMLEHLDELMGELGVREPTRSGTPAAASGCAWSWRTVCSARCVIILPRCRGCVRRGRKKGPGWGCWWSARSPAAGAPAARRRAKLCGANCRCPRTTRAPHPWNRDARRVAGTSTSRQRWQVYSSCQMAAVSGPHRARISRRWAAPRPCPVATGDVARLAGYQR
jgi:hypothetical protein